MEEKGLANEGINSTEEEVNEAIEKEMVQDGKQEEQSQPKSKTAKKFEKLLHQRNEEKRMREAAEKEKQSLEAKLKEIEEETGVTDVKGLMKNIVQEELQEQKKEQQFISEYGSEYLDKIKEIKSKYNGISYEDAYKLATYEEKTHETNRPRTSGGIGGSPSVSNEQPKKINPIRARLGTKPQNWYKKKK